MPIMKQTKCKICHSQDNIFIKTVKDSNHFLKGSWSLIKCRNCSAYFLSDPPKGKDMEFYYPQKYYTHTATQSDNKLLTIIYGHHYKINRNFVSYCVYHSLKSFVNMFPKRATNKQLLLLDIGCGNGSLMLRFKKYGYLCTGFDVDHNSIEKALKHGLDVKPGNIFNIEFNKKFDIIIMNQVLEHIDDPIKYLKRIKSLLTPNGQLIVSVPNSSCLDFRILKDSWSSFQAPTHIFHFNSESLHHLLNKTGYDIEKIDYSISLNAIKPSYLKKNLHNIIKIEKSSFSKIAKITLFILSSIFAFVPFFNQFKKIRISVYCSLCDN